MSNIASTTLLLDKKVPEPYQSVLNTPNVVLINIMACRVFRKTKLGLFREEELSTSNMMTNGIEPIPVFFMPSRSGVVSEPMADNSSNMRGLSHVGDTKSNEEMEENLETSLQDQNQQAGGVPAQTNC